MIINTLLTNSKIRRNEIVRDWFGHNCFSSSLFDRRLILKRRLGSSTDSLAPPSRISWAGDALSENLLSLFPRSLLPTEEGDPTSFASLSEWHAVVGLCPLAALASQLEMQASHVSKFNTGALDC